MSVYEFTNELGNKRLGIKGTFNILKTTIKDFDFLKDKKSLNKLLLILMVNIIMPVTVPILNKNITNTGLSLYKSGDNKTFTILFSIIISLFLINVINSFIYPIKIKIINKLQLNVHMNVRSKILLKCSQIKLKYINDAKVYDRIEFLNVWLPYNIGALLMNSFNILTIIATIVSVGILVFLTNWLVGIIIIIGSIPQMFFLQKCNDFQYRYASWATVPNRQRGKAFSLGISSNPERIAYDFVPIIKERFIEANNQVKNEQKELTKKSTLFRFISSFPATVSYIVALGLVLYQIYYKGLSVGTFSLMITAIGTLMGALTSFSNTILSITYTARFVDDYSYLKNLDEELVSENTDIPKNVRIEFRDVHFTYPGSDREVIKGISLKIEPGEKIAIVGLNGSGKSTFTYLLTGLYKVTSGEVLINGKNIEYDPCTLRRVFSCVFQDFGRYDMSIADNIRVGDTNRVITDEEILEICNETGVSNFLGNFKNGIHTILGDMGDEGANLSGGQWQRVMIARALIRKGTSVLIFDEPTAALDPKSEAQLYKDFNTLTADKTTITISHRLGITGIVNRILVFEDGKIVEDGCHEDLISKDGLYSRMYYSQAQWYK
ncbi:MAG: hypothetical protein BGN88_09800 [Clostridiales bacterium 43-6]|nr:MAG: hypothetical protein BGN88_09800 [Clostridiales bacterium 43-6]